MSLGFSFGGGNAGGGGDFLAYVKYDARAGRMKRVDRSQATGTWLTEEVDITRNFKACFDLENVEVGWINFQTGGPPAFALVPWGQPFPAKPGDGQWKQGVRFMLELGKGCRAEDGVADIREISSNAEAFLRGIDELHTEYLSLRQGHTPPYNLPVVELADTKPVVSQGSQQSSTNYQPIFKIVDWVRRPAALVFRPKAGIISPEPKTPDRASPPSGQDHGFGSPPAPISPQKASGVSSLPRFEDGNGYNPPPMNRPPQTGGTVVGAPVASGDDFG